MKHRAFLLAFALLLVLLSSGSVSATPTGGAITYDGDYIVHTFTSSGTFNVTDAINVSILIVAGGGGGGNLFGGGGAGGLIYNNSYNITAGSHAVTIGLGGGGGASNSGTAYKGVNGGNSVFDSMTATGGGGGGVDGASAPAGNGGSGGGGGAWGSTAYAGGTGIAGQGYAGGTGNSANGGGGGGGGASEVGAVGGATQGGKGGDGLAYSINGSNTYYAGGGGAGAYSASKTIVASEGGLGGGGDNPASGLECVGDGTNGTDGLGGGGGGGTRYNTEAGGGYGGSGIVIIRYLTSSPSTAPVITAHTTSPANVYTNTDFLFYMTATDSDNATINAYVQFYVNGTASGATQSQAIANNTNTLIGTLSSSDFGTGAELIAEYWASDGINSTTKANQSTVTIQPPAFEISINSPADDTQTNNNTPGFSFTVSGSSDTYSCSLFLNDSSYGTNSSTLDSTATTIIASTIPDGIYTWYVNCTSDVTTNQSEIRTITIDTEAPAINDNFINNSAYLQNTITGQFNFTDNILLHSLNISIDDSAIYTNESIDATFLQYDLSIDPATLSNGVHELFIRIADGHTAIQLKSPDAYNPSNGIFNNYARYSIRKPYPALDITMYLKDQSVFDSWEITKKSDRYSETLRPSKPLTTQIFIVESDQYIYIINDPKGNYKGQWLIIGDHWKDFVLKNEPGSKVSITRITNNKVEVTISGIKNTEELTFESTGDLNIVTKTYNFYVSNSSINSPAYSFETDYQTITFEINKTGNVSTNAELYWNSTFKESTKTSYTNYDKYTAVFRTPFIENQEENITAYWDYNVTDGSTESNNITFNQTAYRMSIDTCSEYTAKAINFTLMDEVLNEPLTIDGEIHAAMQISRSNVSDYRTTNLDYTGSSNYSLCIYPSWANYTIDFTNFEYMADGYSNREYSTSAFEISNATQEIKLYLINLSDSTNVIMSLRDSNDDVLEGYNIRVKRYYPATGEEVTSEISRTDYNGQAIARLVLYNYYYSFSIEELDGTVIKLISPSKIYSEFLTFVVDVEEEELNFEDKVWYSISPDSPVQSQPVNFSFITISPGFYIEWFAIGTRFNSTDYLDNSTDADGGTVTIELDLTNQTGWLSITYYIQAANETLLTFDRGYFVTDIVPGDYSIEGQREGWEDIFGVMWRVVVAVLVSIIAVLLLVPFIGPESAGVVGVLSQIGFTIMGWIPLWMIIVEAVILIGLYLMSNRGQV